MKIYTEILGFLLLTLQICSTQRTCPETAECINLMTCPPLLQLLLQADRDTAGTQYLREQQCGFEGRNPLVCCPRERNGTSTTKPEIDQINSRGNSLLPYPNCGDDLSPKIVGGEKTDISEFPWMALLEYQEEGYIKLACGGSIINNRYVLTAAHCIVPNLIGVRLGEYDTTSDQDCVPENEDSFKCTDPIVKAGIEEKIVHPNYVPDSLDQFDDIALLRLDKNIEFTNFIKPICLPNTPSSAKNFVLVGWGATETKSHSNIKLKVGLPLVGRESCQKAYVNTSRTITEKQLCAGGQRSKDGCRGDSGGPLMTIEPDNNGIGRWTGVGVVSYGHKFCGKVGWPGIYTQVSTYMPWIKSVLKP